MYKILTKSDELPAFFPLTMTFSNDMPDTGEHTHDCVEIGIVLRGKAAHLYNGDTRFLYPGDVLILAPEQRHSFPEVENFSMCNVLFHPRELNIPQQDLVKFPGFQDIFNPDPDDYESCRHFFHLVDDDFRHIRMLLSLMRKEQKNIGRSGYRSAMLGLFMNFLCHLLRSYCSSNESAVPNYYEQNVESAVKYLKMHYLKPFDLEYLLKISAMSRSNFIKRFRIVAGVSPMQFVIRKRIAHAARMIAVSDLPISQIAIECGFCDSSHFSKCFRNVTGESPRAYRQRMRQYSDRENFWSDRKIDNPFVMDWQ